MAQQQERRLDALKQKYQSVLDFSSWVSADDLSVAEG